MLPQALAPLAQWPQFVVWRLEWNAERSKWDKIPYSPKGFRASSTDPKAWGSYQEAKSALDAGGYDGVGFVFSELDPFWFLDIDGAYVDGHWSLLSQELCARLDGVAVEVSQSGTGLHLIGSGAVPVDHGNRNVALSLELYTKERFVALTGTHARGHAAFDASALMPGVVEQFFTRVVGTKADEWTTEPDPEWSGPEDDIDLLERALRSGKQSAASAFGGAPTKATFEDLFSANADVLGAIWPADKPGDGFNHSHADQSFANLLAFWTGRNCERIERIMRMSSLARPKWDVHGSYLQNTILKAVGLVRTVYKQPEPSAPRDVGPAPAPEVIEASGMEVRMGGGLMLYQRQVEHFAGCIYVRSVNKILTPSGDSLDISRFNVEYGGYEFILGVDGKKTTRSAFEAYTQNENFHPAVADRLCFRPEEGAGGIVRDGGKVLANTFHPAEPDDLEGDPSKFVGHIKRMLPHGDDAELLIGWMATAVQNPGEKIQWWPVVQGAEGNFKSFLLLVMETAVGSHYAHLPNMDKMIKGKANFNGWLEGKLFLGLEEVYASNRREFFESFKPIVTNLRLPIEGKGIEEVTGDNRANGIITTNHQDGVPVLGVSRRLAAFFCAQQTPADMIRDGMTPEYVLDLKNWLLGKGPYSHLGRFYGVRVMAGHLRRMKVEDRFNPLNMSRAPETSSTSTAISASRGRVEQEILEAVEEDRPGFAGGWVSSIFLDKLLDNIRGSVPRNKRREVMQSIGFDYHPALGERGRVNNLLQPDNGKPRLYIRHGHISLNLETAAEVAKAYTKAQERTLTDQAAHAFGT